MENEGVLYVVATPIGNLLDISYRAIEILKNVDLIACEDTRVTKKILSHYNINVPTISYFQHSKISKTNQLISKIKEGKNIALVTDAGTPGISDPGNKLVSEMIENKIKVVPIPGASALASLISVAGIDLQRFVFLGFPPHKKGRETFFKEIIETKYPVIYFESPHRVIKNLELLKKLGTDKKIILGRELTKIFEEVVRGNADEVIKYFEDHKEKIKGEFVLIIY